MSKYRLGGRMEERVKTVQETLEALLRTQQTFNLKELAMVLDIPVDVAKAVSQYKVNRLRKMVHEIGEKLGLHVFCDYHGNVIVLKTLEEVEGAINSKMSQVTGRSEQMLFLMQLRDRIRSNSNKRRSDDLGPNQMTLAHLAPNDEFLASQFPSQTPHTPVVALRSKDLGATRREFMTILLTDPKLMEDSALALQRYYQVTYGFEVPIAMFMPDTIQPHDLLEMWQQLVTGLRRLSSQPDFMRQASGHDGLYH